MKRMLVRGVCRGLILTEVFSFRTLSMGLCEGLTRHAAPVFGAAPPLSDVPDTAESD